MQAPTEESFGFAERFLCLHLPKSGKQIPQRHCLRDPLSPPFHVNLIYGLRFFQAG